MFNHDARLDLTRLNGHTSIGHVVGSAADECADIDTLADLACRLIARERKRGRQHVVHLTNCFQHATAVVGLIDGFARSRNNVSCVLR